MADFNPKQKKKKNTERNIAVKLLPTYSEVKLGDRLESRKKGKSKMFNIW